MLTYTSSHRLLSVSDLLSFISAIYIPVPIKMAKQPRSDLTARICLHWIGIFFLLFLLVPTGLAFPSVGRVPLRVFGRDEAEGVNPIAPKFSTVPDRGKSMPDFSVTAKVQLSTWNDTELSLETTRRLPGVYYARVPIANGYVICFSLLPATWISVDTGSIPRHCEQN